MLAMPGCRPMELPAYNMTVLSDTCSELTDAPGHRDLTVTIPLATEI